MPDLLFFEIKKSLRGSKELAVCKAAEPRVALGSGDAGLQVRKLEPPPGGSIFRFAAIPPEDPKVSREQRERQTAKPFAQMDAAHCRSDTSRHPGMHKTRTIDYVVLLSPVRPE
jgi:hypothetical protein